MRPIIIMATRIENTKVGRLMERLAKFILPRFNGIQSKLRILFVIIQIPAL